MDTQLTKSCCFLSKDGGYGQGIIIQHRGQLYLLTCHHIIPSKKESSGWNVNIYAEESINLDIYLNESIVGRCISCCGEDGILGECEHFPSGLCPLDLDFILLELNNSKLEEMSSEFVDLKLSIDALKVLKRVLEPHDFFQNDNASCFYMRNKEHQLVIKEHYFFFPPLPTGPPRMSVLRDWSFQVSCFEVVKDNRYDVCGGGSSGAPMYATHKSNQPVLIGMHTSHKCEKDGNEVDDDSEVIIKSDELQLTKSFNTNFSWVLYLINLHVYFGEDSWFRGDFPLTETGIHKSLLWAVFLRYQKETLILKDKSLLAKIAEEICRDLVRSHSQPQLEGEEKEMFDKVQNFLAYEDPEESLVTGLEGASIEPPPENTQTTGYGTVTDTNISNPDSDNNPPEEVHVHVASEDELV